MTGTPGPAWEPAEPFVVQVDQGTLDDLHERLARTRLAPDLDNEDWSYGVNGAYLAELVHSWRTEFDWRAQERRINELSHYRTVIDGIPIHFVHERGKGPDPTPIILTHGWPWTFWDFHDVIGPLTDPVAYGGSAEDSFDVIVPSLPGFGFSTPLRRTGMTIWDVADVWKTLMVDVLGYPRFAAHGGDYGVMVTAQLGHKYPEHLLGLHFAPRPLPLHAFNTDRPWADLFANAIPSGVGDRATFVEYERRKVGHVVAHVLDPQTLAHALHDSPAGLAAWLLERRRSWSDCGGDVESAFSRDDLLTSFTIYWASDSFVSTARLYHENAKIGWQPSHDRTPVVGVPTAVTVFEKDLPPGASMAWMEEYFDLRQVTSSPTGGHFAAAEEPDVVVRDIRSFLGGAHRGS
ncbi:epoxide hydrolase family protein [Nocardioides humi]|uniref:Epoxide hydrolase n=1 Tax=Nocardioides humi TaxID=449461 RepID=A0ABN2A429_9ACTN|nr:epoxide hydrolase family protein [Nocardioides humi]